MCDRIIQENFLHSSSPRTLSSPPVILSHPHYPRTGVRLPAKLRASRTAPRLRWHELVLKALASALLSATPQVQLRAVTILSCSGFLNSGVHLRSTPGLGLTGDGLIAPADLPLQSSSLPSLKLSFFSLWLGHGDSQVQPSKAPSLLWRPDHSSQGGCKPRHLLLP